MRTVLAAAAFVCLGLACAPASDPAPASPAPDRTGGTSGADPAGSGGGGATGGASAGGQGGAGSGGAAEPGAGGTGGAPSTGGSTGADASGEDVPLGAGGTTGALPDADPGDGAPFDPNDPSTWPGGAFSKPFIKLCPEGASKANCCLHYCTCMMTYCSKQIPADCMSACLASDKWDMRCRVYNCFESLNPNAQKDHQAHCEHAGVYTGTQRTRGAGDTHTTCHMAGDPDEK
jgi:hypothetical protein